MLHGGNKLSSSDIKRQRIFSGRKWLIISIRRTTLLRYMRCNDDLLCGKNLIFQHIVCLSYIEMSLNDLSGQNIVNFFKTSISDLTRTCNYSPNRPFLWKKLFLSAWIITSLASDAHSNIVYQSVLRKQEHLVSIYSCNYHRLILPHKSSPPQMCSNRYWIGLLEKKLAAAQNPLRPPEINTERQYHLNT